MMKIFMLVWVFALCFQLHLTCQVRLSQKPCKYWCPTKKYYYSAVYMDSVGKILSQETLTITPSGKIWETDAKQTLLTFQADFSIRDSIALAPHPQNGKISNWMRTYQEGAIEDSVHIWMHPIRQNQYLLTEIAPFPEVIFPLVRGKTWSKTLWIYEVFGTFKGTVNSVYMIEGTEARKYAFGTYKCWKITATGTHDKLGENTVVFYFNEDLGFTEMHYTFFNDRKLIFTLINL